MYLACNRLEFTRETFTTLVSNTDWRYVHELFVYDDGSVDGTREWLEDNSGRAPSSIRFVKTDFGSPVTAMAHFIESASAPILAKTDNDAMLPPGWLRQSLEVLDRRPELSMLGIEALYPQDDDVHLLRSYTPAQFVSGLGLYRRAAFARSRPRSYQKWFGFEDWQRAQGPNLTPGWITPSIPVFLLDRAPFEPWSTYTSAYVRRGWQRPWPKYESGCALWRWRWPDKPDGAQTISAGSKLKRVKGASQETKQFLAQDDCPAGNETAGFKVVILSARASNLVPCVQSLLRNEPALPPDHIIVVDDGARSEAEAQLPPLRWLQGIKPFVYARNANLGITEAGSDVILLNDDARLLTLHGFTSLSEQMRRRPRVGICSAGIRGTVGNPRQIISGSDQFRLEKKMLAFVCVYIPKATYERLGPLDERFTGYGFEDNDYCARAIAAGLQLGVWDGCAVDHSEVLQSTFRTRSDLWNLFRHNQQLFREKWKGKYD
jgi:GT2 family glycosyltransferase